MNGPEILQIIWGDLQRAVARHGVPPTPRSLDVSPWLAMSIMQKAIRRGREDLALNAAATLLCHAPDKLWRRIGCIAFEDIGVAGLEAVGITTAALAGKQARAALGGEWAVASCLVSELSRAPKCRAADDLLMACELHPACAEARANLPLLTTGELVALATGHGPVHERALALSYALGTNRRTIKLVSRRGEPRLVFDALCEAGWPHSIVEVAREGFSRSSEMLCPFVALLATEPSQSIRVDDELPPETMFGDVPSWALDIYSREGRAALGRFLETDAAAARWMREHVKASRRIAFLGHIVFRVEGGLAANRRRWPLADELRRQVDVERSGPERHDATEILELMRADLPLLNEVRAAITGSFRHAAETLHAHTRADAAGVHQLTAMGGRAKARRSAGSKEHSRQARRPKPHSAQKRQLSTLTPAHNRTGLLKTRTGE